jgi:hypothetical protein
MHGDHDLPTHHGVDHIVRRFLNHLYARDDGRFANSPLKEWFDCLASRNGLCCAFADGVSVQDVDWDAQVGHYRVRTHGQWLVVLLLSRETPRPVQHLSPA